MQRRDFFRATVAAAVAAELGVGKAQTKVAAVVSMTLKREAPDGSFASFSCRMI